MDEKHTRDRAPASITTTKCKIAVVTGASSGIGRTTAVALCEAGWNVVLSARRESELRETAKLCSSARQLATPNAQRDEGEMTLVVTGDVTKEEDVKALFDKAVAEYGRVDLLFNNAGISGSRVPLEDVPLSELMAVLNINLVAAVLCTQQAIKTFKKQSPPGGRIINNGSLAAYVPRPHMAAYAISKHAILGLTKSTSLECRGHGIACTQIDIGNAMTDMASSHASVGALQGDGTVKKEVAIDTKHVASSIVHIASLPLDVTVLQMNVMATEMPYVGRG